MEQDEEILSEDEEFYEANEATFPENILELNHSFGYNSKRLFNLVLIDENTLVFASGNYLHYFDIPSKTITLRRSTFNVGIGFITKNEHPDFDSLLTVGENGSKPTIFIYEYPSHDIRVKLEGAAKAIFTCGAYNSTGELFASQAGAPDFTLTIWRWQTAEKILKSKAFQNDVLYVHFSLFNPKLLVSCGLSHIKFWKMTHTFTGLKLKGDLGRFGKTDFSDIYAAFMLPDENVISGCEWGNILLWEAGLIKFEITRKGRKPCHTKPIVRITMSEGEVTTIGMDGYMRVWFWETVDLADPPDDDRFVEIEPIYEVQVGDCEIRGLAKIKPFDNNNCEYYAQDGKGGIWFCDLNMSEIPKDDQKLLSTHDGAVKCVQTSPVSHHFITLGSAGRIMVYDYLAHKLLFQIKYETQITDILWLDTRISETGFEMILGYQDGVIRLMLLDIKQQTLHLIQAVKGHTAPIIKIALNPSYKMLLVASADSNVFIFDIAEKLKNYVLIKPIGFISLTAIPNFINWRSDMIPIIGAKTGEVFEFIIPQHVTEEQTYLSYKLNENVNSTKFVSIKSRIRRDIRREEIKKRKLKKRAKKWKEIQKLMKANPGLQIDVEAALADSEPDEEEPPLYIPPKPNSVLWLKLTDRGTIWVSMGGYDAGYVYELEFGYKEPISSTIITDGDDIEICCFLDLPDYSIHGLMNGCLRVNKLNHEDFRDMTDYRLFPMHDHLVGRVTGIALSFDGEYVFSVGNDGNVFMYNWLGPILDKYVPPKLSDLPKLQEKVQDIMEPDFPSLEQQKIFAEQKRQQEAALAHELKVRSLIKELAEKFMNIYEENLQLNEDIRLKHRDMLLDERIVKEISDELQFELDDVRDDLAYDLEVAQVGKTKLYNHFLKDLDHVPIVLKSLCVPSDETLEVYSFPLRKLGEDFEQCKRDIEERLRKEGAQRGEWSRMGAEGKVEKLPERRPETFFFGRDSKKIVPRFNRKMLRLLRRYRARQTYEVKRMYDWEKLIRGKPDPNADHPDDVKKILEAQKNLGDYKLKIGDDYEAPPSENLTNKYIETVNYREKLFYMLDEFNKKLFALQEKKKQLYAYVENKQKRLDLIHALLPPEYCKYMPLLPEVIINEEFPESNLVEVCTPGCGIQIKDILYLEQTVKDLLPHPLPKLPEQKISSKNKHDYQKFAAVKVHEARLFSDKHEFAEFLSRFPQPSEKQYYLSNSREEPSPWFFLSQYYSLLKLLNEQDDIVFTVEEQIKIYNNELKNMHWMRSHVKLEFQFIHSFMITLNQELMILRDSEQIENTLLDNADTALSARNNIQANINSVQRLVEESHQQIDKINEQIAVITAKFMASVKTHKFFDFLRRIFKKKYRPPKQVHADDESSESSSSESSSEEEDDTKSIDSLDITTIRLDETTCPAGLERSTYELAFKMRAERHALEAAILEQQKLIQLRLAEIVALQKDMKHQEQVYESEKDTLLVFRRKRQQEINKVKVAVVLNMNQLQHFRPGEDFKDLSKAILFDANILVSLQNRVEQLKQETLDTKRWHRINFIHLRRMNADINFMHYEIISLEEQIRTAMMKKFGMILPLDELEESVLGHYVFDIESTAEEELRALQNEIDGKKRELTVLYDELINENKLNVEKVNILGVLQQELNFLNEVLIAQERHFERGIKPFPYDLDAELEKLIVIDKQQQQQIECLEREICTLRLKAKPLQMDTEVNVELNKEYFPPADDTICPEPVQTHAYNLRATPDEFVMDRVQKIVKKCFVQAFGEQVNKDQMRYYAQKVSRYLGQIGYSFEGNISERILDCITESLQEILPKKYLIFLSRENMHNMFAEILYAFDYERSEINMDDLITGIYDKALETAIKDDEAHNKTQLILELMFKELIEILPLEEFKSADTKRALIEVLGKDAIIDPRCISIENFMLNLISYAQQNLLDNITATPLRKLVESVTKELYSYKQLKISCSGISYNSVHISQKKSTSSTASTLRKSK